MDISSGEEIRQLEKSKDQYLYAVVMHPCFYLLDPRTDTVAVNKKTFTSFLKLMGDALAVFNTNQHGGLKVCMYCWSIIMRKKKLTHVGCPILGDRIRPEYTLAEAFGKIDQDPNERFRIFSSLLQECSAVNYQPKAYNVVVNGVLKMNHTWSPVFPKLTIMSDQKHRCYTLFVTPNIDKLKNMYRQSKPKPGFFARQRRRLAHGYEGSWGNGADEHSGRGRTSSYYDDDDFVTDTIIAVEHLPKKQKQRTESIQIGVDSDDSVESCEGFEDVQLPPPKLPRVNKEKDHEAFNNSTIASPSQQEYKLENLEEDTLSRQINLEQMMIDNNNPTFRVVRSPTNFTEPASNNFAPTAIKEEDGSSQTAQKVVEESNLRDGSSLGKNKVMSESNLIKKTLELLGITQLKLVKNGKVIELDLSKDKFYTDKVKVRKELLNEWVMEVLKESGDPEYNKYSNLPQQPEYAGQSSSSYQSDNRMRVKLNSDPHACARQPMLVRNDIAGFEDN